MGEQAAGGITLGSLQRRIRDLYGSKDAARGDSATFLWLAEEFGELATALRSGTQEELASEMAAVLAKYGEGCPGCSRTPCTCDPAEKP